MQNLEVLARKLTELWPKKVNGDKKVKVQKKEKKRKDPTCITRAPMELKNG